MSTSLQWRAACACRRMRAEFVDSMYVMELQWRAACACRRMPGNRSTSLGRSCFNGGRHAHAAEYGVLLCGGGLLHASMEGGMRMPPNRRRGYRRAPAVCASMEGGMRMPPNYQPVPRHHPGDRASMEGGMRMPPNHTLIARHGWVQNASMEGGMRMPPNGDCGGFIGGGDFGFNGGRHAHAAESGSRPTTGMFPTGFNGGRHAHAAECPDRRPRRRRGRRFNGGRHAHAAEWARCVSWWPSDHPSFNGGRHAHAAEWVTLCCCCRRTPAASMEGGMRMPPNLVAVRQAHCVDHASMEGGMRMPPNSPNTGAPTPSRALQWRAACACRRISVIVVSGV